MQKIKADSIMRILAVCHNYLPDRISGSEIYLHELLKELQRRGHECRVLHKRAAGGYLPGQYEYEGIEVWPETIDVDPMFQRADIVLCQLYYTKWAIYLAHKHNKTVFHITHSSEKFPCIDDMECKIGVIYNSENGKRDLNYLKPSIVFPPIIREFKSEIRERKYITQINVNEQKGGQIFYEIAKRLPKHQFFAQHGSYGDQIIEELPNVARWINSPNLKPTFAYTRILLVPSLSESYSMAAAEAIKAGIPVICTKGIAGLEENLGDAGIYVERNDIDEWIRQIKILDNKKAYLHASEISKIQASKKIPNFDQLENFLMHGLN